MIFSSVMTRPVQYYALWWNGLLREGDRCEIAGGGSSYTIRSYGCEGH